VTGVHRRLESAVMRWLRGSLRLAFWCGVGSVLAGATVAWMVAAVGALLFSALNTWGSEEAVSSALGYLMIGTLAVVVPAAVTAARAWRYNRAEHRAEHRRWDLAQPFLDAALAEQRARQPKDPKPALPRPVGMAVEPGGGS
jgi:hypothetical protein